MARQEDHTEEAPAKDTGNKKIIIMAVAVVVSAALIGGALFFGLNRQHAPAKAEAGTEAAATEGGGEKKGEAAKKKEAPAMYPLEAFIVNIGTGNDMHYLKIKIELETGLTKEAAKAELDPYTAKLRDAILVLLTTKSVADVQDLPGKNKLREEILANAKKVMPTGKISNIYFTDFVVQ